MKLVSSPKGHTQEIRLHWNYTHLHRDKHFLSIPDWMKGLGWLVALNPALCQQQWQIFVKGRKQHPVSQIFSAKHSIKNKWALASILLLTPLFLGRQLPSQRAPKQLSAESTCWETETMAFHQQPGECTSLGRDPTVPAKPCDDHSSS